MKILILSLLLLIAPISPENYSSEKTVYICTGSSSKKYHADSKCRGLGGCKGQTKAISIKDATAMGRTPCGICKP